MSGNHHWLYSSVPFLYVLVNRVIEHAQNQSHFSLRKESRAQLDTHSSMCEYWLSKKIPFHFFMIFKNHWPPKSHCIVITMQHGYDRRIQPLEPCHSSSSLLLQTFLDICTCVMRQLWGYKEVILFCWSYWQKYTSLRVKMFILNWFSSELPDRFLQKLC